MREFTMKTIFFGNYWQSTDKTKEPIAWIVLKEDDDKMYVISKDCLDCVPYCDDGKIAWKNSIMRKWLNDYFLNEAFSDEEQDKIMLAKIKTSNGNRLDEGTSTQDKIFLPSVSEANFYFGTTGLYDILLKQKRIARPTQYAFKQGCWVSGLEYGPVKDSVLKDCLLRDSTLTAGAVNPNMSLWQYDGRGYGHLGKDTANKRFATSWYLRSSGNEVIRVEPNGLLERTEKRFVNIGATNKHTAVRPAMWIKK